MIQLSGAGKRFGTKLLFEDLNWMITPQDRAGLVGANGSGKTTLLKVLAGLESLDYGKLSVTRGVSSGYLAARRPVALRPHCLRRMHVGIRIASEDGSRDGRAHA